MLERPNCIRQMGRSIPPAGSKSLIRTEHVNMLVVTADELSN